MERDTVRGNVDLLAAGLVGLLGAALSVAGPGPARLALGFALCLFLPGYALSAALYPRAGELRWAERIAVSVGSSIVALILIAVAIDASPWARDSRAPALALAGLIILSLTAAWARRDHANKDRLIIPWSAVKHISVSRAIIVALTGAVLTLAIISWIGRPAPSEAFTSFWALGPGGTIGSPVLSRGAVRGIVGVTNHEGHPVSYRVAVLRGHAVITVLHATVANGATWQYSLWLPARTRGIDHRSVQLLLFREDRPRYVYRRLLLRAQVAR